MSVYRLLRPTYTQIDSVFWRIRFELVRLIKAPSPEDAIAQAKRLGHLNPIVEPATEQIQ